MRAVIQRVTGASVKVEGKTCGAIEHGLIILLAIEINDAEEDINWLIGKILRLRIFDDGSGAMNRSVQDVAGGILLISQFTLFASTRKGNRPSFIRSAPPEHAADVFERFRKCLETGLGRPVHTGRFGAHMDVNLVNDGPVTIIIDSHLKE